MLEEMLGKLLKEADEIFKKTEPIVEQLLRSADGMSGAEFSAMLSMIIERYCDAMEEDAVEYARELAAKIEFSHIMLDILHKAANKKQEGEDEEE